MLKVYLEKLYLLTLCLCVCAHTYVGASSSSIIHLKLFQYVSTCLWTSEVVSQIIMPEEQFYQRSITQDNGDSCIKLSLNKKIF